MAGSDALGAAFPEGDPLPRVQVFFSGDLAEAEARRRAEDLAAALGAAQAADLRRLPDAGWAEAYQRSLRAFAVGERLWLVPSEAPLAEAPHGRLPIVIPPGRAFGTGEHATTSLCLEYLERRVRPGAQVLDVGSGSGILAIAAVRLGAARVVAVEPDREAAAELARNLRRNDVARRVEIVAGDLSEVRSGWFDLAAANILAGTLVELMPAIGALLRPGGGAVLSGIRAEEQEGVAEAAAGRRLRVAERRSRDGWVALHLEKPDAAAPGRAGLSGS